MSKQQISGINLVFNIIWVILFGWETALFYLIFGLILCLVNMPLGKNFIQLARVAFFPFGTKVQGKFMSHPVLNIIWLIFFGWGTALFYLIGGALFCITIVGIPFGLQLFKLAVVTLGPVGASIR